MSGLRWSEPWGAVAEPAHDPASAPSTLLASAPPLPTAWLPQDTGEALVGMGMAFPLRHPLGWSYWWEIQGNLIIPAIASN